MFDILQYTKELEASGWSEGQANTLIKVVSSIMSKDFSTKEDFLKLEHEMVLLRKEMQSEFIDVRKEMRNEFADVRKEMRSEFAGVRKEIAAGFESFENKILIKLGGLMVVLVGLLYTTQKLS